MWHQPIENRLLTPKELCGVRVLVVEDNLIVAMAVVSAIEDAGGEVVGPFSSVTDALENLNAAVPIDCAVLDVGLGDDQSYPLASALEQTHLPFMFLTAVERDALPARFANKPHLQKPYNDQALIDAIGHMAKGDNR